MKNSVATFRKGAFLLYLILSHTLLFAQAPQAFNYQSILRNTEGIPLQNISLNLLASIKEESENGVIVYQELHTVQTNSYGLINLAIGKGIPNQGIFSNIDWNKGSKWMVMEGDFGSGYEAIGAAPLLSVPFALNVLPGPAGTNGTNGIDGINGLPGTNGTNGNDGANGLAGINGTNGIDGVVGLPGTNGINGTNGIDGANGSTTEFAMFYGLTSGTGNSGTTDYPATIAVKTGFGTGRIPFPKNGPSALITRLNTSSFLLPSIGTYEIYFSIQTTEPRQILIELNDNELPETTIGNSNPTAGGHLFSGNVFITTTVINSSLALINASGNATALTITPADGANTHANTQILTIKKIH